MADSGADLERFSDMDTRFFASDAEFFPAVVDNLATQYSIGSENMEGFFSELRSPYSSLRSSSSAISEFVPPTTPIEEIGQLADTPVLCLPSENDDSSSSPGGQTTDQDQDSSPGGYDSSTSYTSSSSSVTSSSSPPPPPPAAALATVSSQKKQKAARKNSNGRTTSESVLKERRDRKLERNRASAARSRQKKKAELVGMQDTLSELRRENANLLETVNRYMSVYGPLNVSGMPSSVSSAPFPPPSKITCEVGIQTENTPPLISSQTTSTRFASVLPSEVGRMSPLSIHPAPFESSWAGGMRVQKPLQLFSFVFVIIIAGFILGLVVHKPPFSFSASEPTLMVSPHSHPSQSSAGRGRGLGGELIDSLPPFSLHNFAGDGHEENSDYSSYGEETLSLDRDFSLASSCGREDVRTFPVSGMLVNSGTPLALNSDMNRQRQHGDLLMPLIGSSSSSSGGEANPYKEGCTLLRPVSSVMDLFVPAGAGSGAEADDDDSLYRVRVRVLNVVPQSRKELFGSYVLGRMISLASPSI